MTTAQDVLNQARADLGYTEKPAGSNRTKFGHFYGLDGQPWCAQAISYWFFNAGLPLPASTSKGFAYTPSGAAYFKRINRWGTTPQVGAVVFYDFPGDSVNRISHVGIVEAVEGDAIVTIEGNTDDAGGRTGGKVMRRRRKVGIVGYGYPEYTGQSTPRPVPTPDHPAAQGLRVDGEFGPLTIRALQRALGVAADGEFGPISKKAFQARLNVATDGAIGPITIKALQRRIGLTGRAIDGKMGPITIRALQVALNAGGL